MIKNEIKLKVKIPDENRVVQPTAYLQISLCSSTPSYTAGTYYKSKNEYNKYY